MGKSGGLGFANPVVIGSIAVGAVGIAWLVVLQLPIESPTRPSWQKALETGCAMSRPDAAHRLIVHGALWARKEHARFSYNETRC